MPAENVFHKTGDGPGKSRVEIAKQERAQFERAIQRSHPSCTVHIAQVRDFGGGKVVFFTVERTGVYKHHRVAIMIQSKGDWVKENDVIVSQE